MVPFRGPEMSLFLEHGDPADVGIVDLSGPDVLTGEDARSGVHRIRTLRAQAAHRAQHFFRTYPHELPGDLFSADAVTVQVWGCHAGSRLPLTVARRPLTAFPDLSHSGSPSFRKLSGVVEIMVR